MTALNDELRLLAERVEAATGPDRELDALIAMQLGTERYTAQHISDSAAKTNQWARGPDDLKSVASAFAVSAYTASIDAAMQLVPEGCVIAHISQVDTNDLQRKWFAEVRVGFVTSYRTAMPIWAATPALALTAAALRARASIEGGK